MMIFFCKASAIAEGWCVLCWLVFAKRGTPKHDTRAYDGGWKVRDFGWKKLEKIGVECSNKLVKLRQVEGRPYFLQEQRVSHWAWRMRGVGVRSEVEMIPP